MINDLSYAISFPTNGISLSGQHTFQPGITAVTGRNGSGKSFGYSEVIRYGLFGKKALRGPASDYKQLDMELSFTVVSEKYRVLRTSRKQQLLDASGEVLAVGAEAVDKKVVEILGFGLEVFDVVCAANQKESERLTKLTPARRKELIDDVVGLTAHEAVEKACRDEANGLRREAEALSRALVTPVEPVRPDGYRPSVEIGEDLRETKALIERRDLLQRTVDQVGPNPVEPDEAEVDVEAIELHEQQRTAQDAHRVAVERQLASMPTTDFTPEQIEAGEAWQAYDAERNRRGHEPGPNLTLKQIEGYLEDWAHIQVLEKVIGTTVACPACGNEFDAGHDVPATPPWTRKSLETERRYHENWATPLVVPQGEYLSPKITQHARLALDQASMRASLTKELAEMKPLADRSAELRAGREVNQKWAIYARDREACGERALAAQAAKMELAKLSVPKFGITELDGAFVAARVYESQLLAYQEQKSRFDGLSAEIAEKQERAEGFTAGAKGLVEARRTLKAFLAPSLSRVASALIQQMTVNASPQLNAIQVDEDMNITADGQDVSTFNGAHATMINLALRLALGQVLVSRVFPVFIGDEIDSDADVNNSQAVADALGALTDQLRQIILISHKRLVNVDHEVVLSPMTRLNPGEEAHHARYRSRNATDGFFKRLP